MFPIDVDNDRNDKEINAIKKLILFRLFNVIPELKYNGIVLDAGPLVSLGSTIFHGTSASETLPLTDDGIPIMTLSYKEFIPWDKLRCSSVDDIIESMRVRASIVVDELKVGMTTEDIMNLFGRVDITDLTDPIDPTDSTDDDYA